MAEARFRPRLETTCIGFHSLNRNIRLSPENNRNLSEHAKEFHRFTPTPTDNSNYGGGTVGTSPYATWTRAVVESCGELVGAILRVK